MQINILKDKIKSLPQSPGIYIWAKGRKKIYIGKAANLRSRLKSYIEPHDNRIKLMVGKATKFDHILVRNEIEALILESQYIKKYQPEFNILMRDDKQYSYVAITQEEYPKIFITHQPHSKFKNFEIEPIGPFTEGHALRQTIIFLRKIFPYCTCHQKHNNYCLNYHLGRCLGFCCLKNPNNPDRKQYLKNISAIGDILHGKKGAVIRKLKKEMILAGQKHEFDKAIEIRDRLETLERIFTNAKILNEIEDPHERQSPGIEKLKDFLKLSELKRIECYDISNIQGWHATGSMVVFTNGLADKSQYRKFRIRMIKGADDTGMLKEVISRRFKHPEWTMPDLIIVDGGKGQLNSVLNIVGTMPVLALTKNAKHIGDHIFIKERKGPISLSALHPAARNMLLAIDSEAHRFAISYYRHLHRKASY